ncbi:hypothetical protein [Streptomyces sp. A012304]|uniref:hypothetical protein n=1 Tax=Streptomyces sp. A012304 TaxID=375446 RepID=UPI0022306575|nr:hypothetical protein [Streptomyces sp. A012304]GKQ39096.1 hypothetical protein ALMP_56250 [Streptomyces sp. A012304]
MSELYGTEKGAEAGPEVGDQGKDQVSWDFSEDTAAPEEPLEPAEVDAWADQDWASGEAEPLEPLEPMQAGDLVEWGEFQDDTPEAPEAPDEADAPETIHEVVDRPAVEHLYDAPISPARYADLINAGDQPIPLFDGPPSRDQTEQGELSDCGVIATLGSVAGHRPEAISDAIQQNEDGTYTVRLHEARTDSDGFTRPTGRQLELTVTPDLLEYEDAPGEPVLARMEGSAWCALMEKAMAGVDQTWDAERRAEWEQEWSEERVYEGLGEGPTPEGYERLNRGSTSIQRAEMLTQLTGEESVVYDFPKGPDAYDQLLDHFAVQLSEGKPVLTGSRGLEDDDDKLPGGVVEGHVYEVVGVQDGKVHLRNPWNEDDPEPLAEKDFMDAFQPRGSRGDYTTLF